MPASYLESIAYYFISQLPPKWVHFGSVSSEGFAQEGICTFTFGRHSLSSAQAHRGFPSELRFPWRASVRTANETSSGDASRAFGVARGGHGTWQLAYFLALYTRIMVRCTWSCVRNPWTLMQ